MFLFIFYVKINKNKINKDNMEYVNKGINHITCENNLTKKLENILEVTKRIILIRHGIYDKENKEWNLTRKWIKQIEETLEYLKRYISWKTSYDLFYSDDTKRIIQTMEIFKKEMGKNIKTFNISEWLNSRDKKEKI